MGEDIPIVMLSGMAADERLFTAFEHGEHLEMRPHAKLFSQRHGDWVELLVPV